MACCSNAMANWRMMVTSLLRKSQIWRNCARRIAMLEVKAEDILETNRTRLKELWTRLIDSPHLELFEER